jgi:hypothetical protein
MGLFSKITRSVTKPLKKVLKSDLGKIALGIGAYRYAPAMWGDKLGGSGGWGAGWDKFAPWLMGADANAEGVALGESIPGRKGPNLWQRMGPWGKAATVGVGAAGLGAMSPKIEDKIDLDVDNPEAHQKYLTNRSMFEDEWADWLVTKGDADTKEEALEMVRNNPMFSEGGRVKANIGLYAGPQGAMNQNMNPNMNQGLMSPNLGPRSMGMNPGAQQTDPRMAQMLQAQKLQGQAGAVPKASEDEELIQLIKMLSSMGVPMEQLRGRTKEELVEMLIAAQGRIKDSPDVKETADVIEEEEIREQEMARGGRIGYDIGGSPHSEVVEEQEDIEMAGTDTPILELEDLPKLLEDFYEIFGRSPTSIDELKSWAANRTTEAPEEVVEEQVVEANTGGRIGSFEGGDPKDRFLSGMTSEWEGIMGEADKFYTDAETVPLVQKGEFPEPETLLKLKKRYEDLENKASDIEGRYEDHEEFLVDDESKPIANKYYIDKVKKFDKEEIRLDEREKKLNEIYNNLDVSGITRSPDFQNWFKLYEAGNPKAKEHSYHDVFEDILFQSEYSKRMRDLKIERDSKAQGGLPRTGYALGQPVIPSKDGMQLDMRDTGGYQPHGKAEKHDDVRALLAQGEFVMTSDAVKGMGGGDRELGAQKMYNLMHSMEAMA